MSIKWPVKYNKATNRRKQWEDLKKKYAAPLKAGKVDFSSDFGAAIDKFESEIKKVADPAFAAKASVDDLEKVSQAGAKAQAIAESYKPKVAKLADPAKKDLVAFLNDVATDGPLWQDNTLFEPETKGNWKITESAAYASLTGHVEIMVRRGTPGVKLIDNNAELIAADPKRTLRPLALAVLDAAKAAQPAATKVSDHYHAALGNPSYVGLLKAESTKAINGSFHALAVAILAYEAYCKGNAPLEKYLKTKSPPDFRGFSEAMSMALDDLRNVAKADQALVVVPT